MNMTEMELDKEFAKAGNEFFSYLATVAGFEARVITNGNYGDPWEIFTNGIENKDMSRLFNEMMNLSQAEWNAAEGGWLVR